MEIDFPVLIMKWLNFSILCGLVLKFGWKPFVDILDGISSECYEKINQSLENRKSSEKLLKINKEKMSLVDQEIESFMNDAAKDSIVCNKQIEEETLREIEHLKKHSKAEIKHALFTIRSDVQKKFASEAIELTQKIISDEVNKTDLKNLNNNFISMIEGNNG